MACKSFHVEMVEWRTCNDWGAKCQESSVTLVVCHHGGAGLVGSLGVNQVG